MSCLGSLQKYNPQVDQASGNFVEGNLKHAINGYIFCNMPDVSFPPMLLYPYLCMG